MKCKNCGHDEKDHRTIGTPTECFKIICRCKQFIPQEVCDHPWQDARLDCKYYNPENKGCGKQFTKDNVQYRCGGIDTPKLCPSCSINKYSVNWDYLKDEVEAKDINEAREKVLDMIDIQLNSQLVDEGSSSSSLPN